MKKCPNCNEKYKDSYKYCLKCGFPAPKYPTFGTAMGGIGKGLLFVFLFLAIQSAVSMVYSIVYFAVCAVNNPSGIQAEDSLNALLPHMNTVNIISAALTVLAVFLYFAIIKKKMFRELGSSAISPWIVPVTAVFGVALNFFTSVVMEFIPVSEELLKQYEEIYVYMGTGNPFVEFISTAVAAPIVEELIFRGLCYGSMKRVMPKWIGILISSALFGAVHGNAISFVYAGLLGIILCLIYDKTNSIFVPILLHFGFNTGSYFVEMLPATDDIMLYIIVLASAMLVSLVCAFLLFKPSDKYEAENILNY